MSSILDALNKLEKEVSPQDYPLAHARTARKRFIPKSTLGIIVSTCVCVGALGLTAYYWMRPEDSSKALLSGVRPVRESRPPETQESEASAHAQKPPVTSLPETPVPLPSISPVPKPMATATKSQPETPEGKNNTTAIQPQQLPFVESQEDAIQEAVVSTASQKSEPRGYPGETDPPTSVNDLTKEVPAREEKPLPMNRIEGVGFKIQAISWGDTSPERLVVINNQVLREGDGIEGYRISRINPDDIILRRGSNTYRLDFGLKGKP